MGFFIFFFDEEALLEPEIALYLMKTLGLFFLLTLRCFAILFLLVTIDYQTIALRVKRRQYFRNYG